MNKQLERDLQACIQSLNAQQLVNVLSHYEMLIEDLCEKSVLKKGMNYECEIIFRNQKTKGFGRNEQESLSNATKNLLSGLVSKNTDINKITQSIKYKNGTEVCTTKTIEKQRDQTIFLDDISIIEPNNYQFSQKKQKKDTCDCIYYESHKYQQNEIKHLQARVNLLNEENTLLKKMLFCGGTKQTLESLDKENQSIYANNSNSKMCQKNMALH